MQKKEFRSAVKDVSHDIIKASLSYGVVTKTLGGLSWDADSN